VSSGGSKTGTSGTGGTGSTGAGSTGSGSGTPSLSPAEQQLANQLNPAIFYDCTARPDLETGASVAALNCSYSGVTLTMRPAIESFAAGNAAAWFHQWTTGFKSGTNCVGGSFVGSWYHGSTTEGQMGCALLAGGILRIVWVLGQVGFIAEGPDPTAVDTWWKSNACALVGGC
jgi:hypothetical protein